MLFNSWSYLCLFLPIVFGIYWFPLGESKRLQNYLLLFSSYLFYGLWDYRFLSLIFVSSLTDYVIAILLSKTEHIQKRKSLLAISICVNLGILGYFKYYNFFSANLCNLLSGLGLEPHKHTLNILLPVGISFYTFQTLGYTIDVYKRKLPPCRDWLDFFLFVCFFPQLVAGPIERAKKLIPQLQQKRTFSYENGKSGFKLILWGLFMKVVVADSCAVQSDWIFANFRSLDTFQLLLGSFYFMIQLYGDFAGYSNMAIGSAKLFGIDLSLNFRTPLLSRSPVEFWTRWHLTLTAWFTDYVFKPLGIKAKRNKIGLMLAYYAVFALIGFWHGPKWTFIFTFTLIANYYIPRILINHRLSKRGDRVLLKDTPFIIGTMAIMMAHMVLFRSISMSSSLDYYRRIFTSVSYEIPPISEFTPMIYVFVLLILEILYFNRTPETYFNELPTVVRWTVYLLLSYACLSMLSRPQPYIYFQF